MTAIARYEVTEGNGRSVKEILEQEILMVKNNKWLTDKEKAVKIQKLERSINGNTES